MIDVVLPPVAEVVARCIFDVTTGLRNRTSVRRVGGTLSKVNDDDALQVIRYAEELVGEDRYGGAWIDRSSERPELGIALVEPQASDVVSIQNEARRAGWSLTIDAARYSRAQLIAFYDGLEGPKSEAVMAFGWDPRVNKVAVSMSAPDAAAVATSVSEFPTTHCCSA